MPVYKLIKDKEKSPTYFFLKLIPENNTPYTMKSVQKVKFLFHDKNKLFQNSFFLEVIME